MVEDNQTPSETASGGAKVDEHVAADNVEANDTEPTSAETEPTAETPAPEDKSADAERAVMGSDGDGEASKRRDGLADPKVELLKLIDLAVKYPEIGPALAELAFKVGHPELGDRVVRMGLDREGPGLEYYFVAAHSARRDKRYADARKLSIEAIGAFVQAPDAELADDDGERLLHLVRLGFSTMLFDEKDPKSDPGFVEGLKEALSTLEPRLGSEAFYHALLAQTRWYDDVEASEKAWDRAVDLDDTESTWNARGTWYKDADRNLDGAEVAYRRGLEKAPTSPLLLHNLGQLLVDKSERPDVDLEQSRRLLREADQHLRAALREESPKGLRRHVHATLDRLASLRASFPPRDGKAPPPEPAEPIREPEVGEVLQGRVRSLTGFGAFVILKGCGTGLLHKSEIAHNHVEEPSEVLKVGEEIEVKVLDVGRKDGKLRIGLSRKALLPRPERESRESGPPAAHPHERSGTRQDRGKTRGRRDGPSERARRGQEGGGRAAKHGGRRSSDDDKLASLGEMLLAKMNKGKKD